MKEVRSASVSAARRRFVYLVIVWVLGLALSATGVYTAAATMLPEQALQVVPFHPDEARRVYMARLFDLYFLERDWHDEIWFHRAVGPDQHVGHYVLGWALWRAGLPRDRVEWYNYKRDYESNLREGRVPDEETLLVCRRVSAALGVVTVAGIALLGMCVGRPITAGLAAWLVACCSLFEVGTVRAMQEAPLLFCMTVALVLIVLGFRLLSHPARGAAVGGFVVFVLGGFFAGLSAGTKLNGLIVLPFGAAVAVLLLGQGQTGPLLRRVLRAWVTVVVFLFVALGTLKYSAPLCFSYPAGAPGLRQGFLGGMRDILYFHRQMSVQQRHKHGAEAVAPRLSAKAHIVLSRTLGSKRAYDPPGYANIHTRLGWPVDGPLALLGTVVLGWACVREYRARRRVSASLLILLWVMIVYASHIWWIPLDWPRYFLPPLAFVQLLIAAGLAAPLEWWLMRKPAAVEAAG